MNCIKVKNYMPEILLTILCVMFIWTINFISTLNTIQVQTAITAFNG